MRTSVTLLAAASLLCGPFGRAAAQQPAGAPAAGTPVQLRLQDELKSGRSKKGDRVRFQVAADVKGADGAVLIPAGTPASGVVRESRSAGGFGRPGRLRFTCDELLPAEGVRIALAHDRGFTEVGRSRRGSAVGLGLLAGGATAGGIYGATFDVFGGGADTTAAAAAGVAVFALVSVFQRGKEALAKPGEIFVARVSSTDAAPSKATAMPGAAARERERASTPPAPGP